MVFVGYQAEGTLGRKLIDGAKHVRQFGEEIQVEAHIATLEGISGHADRDMLLNWLDSMDAKPRQVFVNHGDDHVCDLFAGAIHDKLGLNAIAPYSGDEYDLLTGECTAKARIVKVTKISDGRRRGNAAFDRLLAAGKRLLGVIEMSRGLTNKDLSKFADQINALCDKYLRK